MVYVMALAAISGAACAQSSAAPVTTSEAARSHLLKAGTLLDIELAAAVSSKTSNRGEKFPIRLAAPLIVDQATVIPAGAPGVAEVVHAAKSGIGGKPAELIIAGRYLTLPDRQIPIRGLRINAAGADQSTLALAAGMVFLPLALLHGGEIEVPAGARATAKIAQDTLIEALALAPAASDASDALPLAAASTLPQ